VVSGDIPKETITNQFPARIYRYILDFLASGPTAEQIAAFAPTPGMIERRMALVEREKRGGITQAERTELDEYDRIEHLMVMIKTDNLPFLTGGFDCRSGYQTEKCKTEK
jgi:hypothetical protein